MEIVSAECLWCQTELQQSLHWVENEDEPPVVYKGFFFFFFPFDGRLGSRR